MLKRKRKQTGESLVVVVVAVVFVVCLIVWLLPHLR